MIQKDEMQSRMVEIPEFDIEKELVKLHEKIAEVEAKKIAEIEAGKTAKIEKDIPKIGRSRLRRAAAIVFACIFSTAVAAVLIRDVITFSFSKEDPTPAEITVAETAQRKAETHDEKEAAPLRYDNAPLSQIFDDVAKRYSCSIIFNNEAAKALRFHLTIPANATLEKAVEIIGQFDNVNISLNDNQIIIE